MSDIGKRKLPKIVSQSSTKHPCLRATPDDMFADSCDIGDDGIDSGDETRDAGNDIGDTCNNSGDETGDTDSGDEILGGKEIGTIYIFNSI